MFGFFEEKKIDDSLLFTRYNSIFEYEKGYKKDQKCFELEKSIIKNQKVVDLEAYCSFCDRKTKMRVDFLHAGKSSDGKLVPNFRERLVCQECDLNNRLRATYHFLKSYVKLQDKDVYATEEVTPFYNLLKSKAKSLTGSEYLHDKKAGKVFIPRFGKEINNEDLTKLSFKNDQFDVAVSLEVLEHIPDYKKALREIFRVLRRDSVFILSAPFVVSSQRNIIRAELRNGAINHILPAEYHGDPVDSNGCLCFYHFGWEILDDLREAGFSDACVYSYQSADFGYLGEGLILYAKK
jgi:hypothetical protein